MEFDYDHQSRRIQKIVSTNYAGAYYPQTTMIVAWIAERLRMGTAGHLNNRLYRWRKGLL